MGKKMKTIIATSLVMCLFASGCAFRKNVFELKGDEYKTFCDIFYSDVPVSVERTFQGVGDRTVYSSSEYNTIKKVFEALKAIKIKGKSHITTTDNDVFYTFIMSDGKRYSFTFENGVFVCENTRYKIDGFDNLNKISFNPTKAPEDISFFEFFGEDSAKWAASFNSKTPDTLSVYVNHCEYAQEVQVFTDTEFIKKVFNLLSHIKIEGDAGDYIDTGTTVLLSFSLNGEKQASFKLHDNDIVFNNHYYKTSGTGSITGLSEIKIDK